MQDTLTDVLVATSSRSIPSDRWHAVIVRLMRGEAARIEGDMACELSSGGDLVVINAGQHATLALGAKTSALLCRIDVRALRGMLNDRSVAFACDPALRHHEGYAELRQYLDALLRAVGETGDFARLRRSSAELALVQCLLDRFGVLASSGGGLSGPNICAYVDTHYAEPIGLSEVARHFAVTPEHLARTFKREVGQTLLAYLTQVRLDAACELLLDGGLTVTRAALDAGFPNVASLNQAFRRSMGTTPSAWRRSQSARPESTPEGAFASLGSLLDSPREEPAQGHVVRFSAHDVVTPGRSWCEAVGIGTVETLRSARVREQVLGLSERVPFRHWRIVFELDALLGEKGLRRAEGCLDFMLDAGLCPRLSLEALSLDGLGPLVNGLDALLRRCVNRYSVQTVRSWEFDLHCKHDQLSYDRRFLELFSRVGRLLQRYGVESLMGPGTAIGSDGGSLRLFLRGIKERKLALSGVTVACRPEVSSGSGGAVVRTADSLYLKNQLMLAREVLAQEGIDPDLVVVGSWRTSLGRRNIMSDSCFAGAAMMRSHLSCRGLASSVCYDWAFDRLCYQDAGDERAALAGLPGLMTRDGVPKPALHALDFLGHADTRLTHADEHAVASANDMGNYQVVCHNCEQLGARYLATPEDELSVEDMGSYFDNPSSRSVDIAIRDVRNGSYLVKTRIVNARGGSVADAARRMNLACLDDPGRGEVDFLMAGSLPQLRLERVRVDDGTLRFSHELQSNEIAYLHFIYLY